ncbi:uncharacterized protein LOC141911625 [Tubulanus polymorphus]|uniref:uncharacterized protein LOC141911625 n=1 Tax=Tubulanus polymorphus TaxID=672921 RepID=UPI003DA39259
MFRINAMQLVGLEAAEGLHVSWLPDGIMFEISKHKLDALKEQVETLRQELQHSQQRQQQAESTIVPPRSAPTPSDTVQSTTVQQTPPIMGQQHSSQSTEGTVPPAAPPETATTGAGAIATVRKSRHKDLDEIGDKLDAESRKKLDEIYTEMQRAEQDELNKLRSDSEQELNYQLRLMKTTMEELNAGVIEVMKDDFKREQQQKTSAESNSQKLKQGDDEETVSDLLEKLKSKLSTQHQNIIQSLGEDFEAKHKENLNKLRSENEDKMNGASGDQEDGVRALSRELFEIKTQLESELNSIRQIKRQLSEARPKYDSEIQQLQLQLQNAYTKDDVEQLNFEHEREMKELRTYFENRCSEIESNHRIQLDEMKLQHHDELMKIQPASPSAAAVVGMDASFESSADETDLAKDRQQFMQHTMLTVISDEEITPSSTPEKPSVHLAASLSSSPLRSLQTDDTLTETQIPDDRFRQLEQKHQHELETVRRELTREKIEQLDSLTSKYEKDIENLMERQKIDAAECRQNLEYKLASELSKIVTYSALERVKQMEDDRSKIRVELEEVYRTESRHASEASPLVSPASPQVSPAESEPDAATSRRSGWISRRV